MPSETQSGFLPVVVALVLAEDGNYEVNTDQYSLAGSLTELEAPVFPCTLSRLCAYVALSDGRGETPVTIRLVDADEQRVPLFEATLPVNFLDPMQSSEIMIIVPKVRVPQPGAYRAQVWVAGPFLGERRLSLRQGPGNSEGGT